MSRARQGKVMSVSREVLLVFLGWFASKQQAVPCSRRPVNQSFTRRYEGRSRRWPAYFL